MVPKKRQILGDILKASTLMIHEHGVGVSTAKIAIAAGVSNGALFKNFPTKQALLDAVYVSIKIDLALSIGEFDAAIPLDVRMRQVWDRWLEWERGHRLEYSVANMLRQSGLTSSRAQALGEASMAVPSLVLIEAKEMGLLVQLPLDYLGTLIQHHIEQAVEFDLTGSQLDIAYLVLMNGITALKSS